MRVFLFLSLLLWPVCAGASEPIPGPVPATYVRAYDGDPPTLDVSPWPGMTMRVGVRLRGVDTAELRADCARERRLAETARTYTRRRLRQASTIALHNVARGKYAGRVVARLTVDGRDLAQALINAGLGRPYDGGRRKGWCVGS